MRRILVAKVVVGRIELGEGESHHLRDVLRLGEGADIEVFDAEGSTGRGRIVSANSGGVVLEVVEILQRNHGCGRLTIASAVPKGPRADWMIEKLSELGVDVFVPLATRHSVVLPEGPSKHARWERLAAEAARQSGRVGVMRIGPLTDLSLVLEGTSGTVAYLSSQGETTSILELLAVGPRELTLLIGPEGGWSAEELVGFRERQIVGYRLTKTILRVETAAVAAAAVIGCAVRGDDDGSKGKASEAR